MARWSRELAADKQRLLEQLSGRTDLKLQMVVALERRVAAAAMVEASSDFMLRARDAARKIYEARVDLAIYESKLAALPFRTRMALRHNRHALTGDHALLVSKHIETTTGSGYCALTIVDLRTGKWGQVSLGPHAIHYDVLRVNDVLPTLDNATGRVFVRGVGLDPAAWRQDVFPSGAPIFLPAAGLLAYDLKAIELREPSTYIGHRKMMSGRRRPLPTFEPGGMTVDQLVGELGPAKVRTPSELRWYSIIHSIDPSLHGYLGEVLTCHIAGDRVQTCTTETRWLTGQPKGTPPEEAWSSTSEYKKSYREFQARFMVKSHRHD